MCGGAATKLNRSALGYALLGLLVMNLPGGSAQAALPSTASGANAAPASANADPVYHIEVSMVASCFQMGCEHRLTGKNAVVSQDGHILPARVERLVMTNSGSRPPVPIHLLVVLERGARRRSAAGLANSLERLFSAGWLVSAMRADGTFTPYCDGAGLARELRKLSATPVSAEAEQSAIRNAVDDLNRQAGLRFLLVDTARGKHRTDPAWLAEAASKLDMVYAVDGGKVETFPDCDSAADFDQLGWLCNGTALKRSRSYRDGVAHELSWSKAIKRLLADRKYDYDVKFSLPESANVVARSLTLTLRDPYSYGPEPVHVEFYTKASGFQIDAAGAARKSPAFKLTVIGPVKVTGLNRSSDLEYRHKDLLDVHSGWIGSNSG